METFKKIMKAILDFLESFNTPKVKPHTLKPIAHMPKYGDKSEAVKIYQQALLNEGADPGSIDGVFGRKTKAATSYFQKSIGLEGSGELGPKTIEALGLILSSTQPLPPTGDGMTPYEWVRGELGQKEIAGSKDNPRIRWYHTASANIGSKEYPDETPWCSSILNKAADECGYYKTDNALASSWRNYNVDAGDNVEQGDIVVIDGHVNLADKPFNRKKDAYYYGLGGNQSDSVKVSKYATSRIKAVRKWKKKPGSTTPTPSPIGKIKSGFPKQEWTDFVQAQVEKHELHKVAVTDGYEWCKDGMKSVSSWVHLISAMAKRESGYKPELEYKESFKNSKGQYVISTGLMQISLESIRQSAYKSQDIIKTQKDLHNPYKNLESAINALAYLVKKDKRVGGGKFGAGRYWSVMRSETSVEKTKEVLKQLLKD